MASLKGLFIQWSKGDWFQHFEMVMYRKAVAFQVATCEICLQQKTYSDIRRCNGCLFKFHEIKFCTLFKLEIQQLYTKFNPKNYSQFIMHCNGQMHRCSQKTATILYLMFQFYKNNVPSQTPLMYFFIIRIPKRHFLVSSRVV